MTDTANHPIILHTDLHAEDDRAPQTQFVVERQVAFLEALATTGSVRATGSIAGRSITGAGRRGPNRCSMSRARGRAATRPTSRSAAIARTIPPSAGSCAKWRKTAPPAPPLHEQGNGAAVEGVQIEAFCAGLAQWWLLTSEEELQRALAEGMGEDEEG